MNSVLRPAHLALAVTLVLAALAMQPSVSLGQSVELDVIAQGFDSPIAATNAGDSRLFVVEQSGSIRILLSNGTVLPTPFLDLSDRVGTSRNEQGLLSVAFHPSYDQNGRFFVNYTNLAGDTVIERYLVSSDPNRAEVASAATLLTIPQTFANHNGGQLQFGPDGMLYIGMGDGGSANDPFCAGQDPNSLLGKLLRIDVDTGAETAPFHSIPADNPFVGSAAAPDQAYALGLRNPWRFSFDRMTGDLFLGDVGQSLREEIDLIPSSSGGGQNFGWKMVEGTICRNQSGGCATPPPSCSSGAYTAPILEYPTGADCAVVGGYVYRGSAIPDLFGNYLFADFCSGRIWRATEDNGTWTASDFLTAPTQITSFGEDVDGEIVLTLGDDSLRRLIASTTNEPGTLTFTDASLTIAESGGTAMVTIERQSGSDGEVSVRARTRPGSATATADFTSVDATLSWTDGDTTNRTIGVPIANDTIVENTESFFVDLEDATGGAALDVVTTEITITDDDLASVCTPSPTDHCLAGTRFRVSVSWQSATQSGQGTTVPLTDDSGAFWFFGPDNLELVVKVIDACADFDRFWVFAAGLTDVAAEIIVGDTTTGHQAVYANSLGQAFQPVQDTNAFATCP